MTSVREQRDAMFAEFVLGGWSAKQARSMVRHRVTPRETNEAQTWYESKGQPWKFRYYLSARRAGASHAEVMEWERDNGDLIRVYVDMRRAGLSHEECLRLRRNAPGTDFSEVDPQFLYKVSELVRVGFGKQEAERTAREANLWWINLLKNGFTVQFCRDLDRSATSVMHAVNLTSAVLAGASLGEAVRVHPQILGWYTRARRAGAAPEQINEVLSRSGADWSYPAALQLGVTHDEWVAAQQLPIKPYDYIRCRKLGASHEQVVEMLEAGSVVDRYRKALRDGLSHTEAMVLARRKKGRSRTG